MKINQECLNVARRMSINDDVLNVRLLGGEDANAVAHAFAETYFCIVEVYDAEGMRCLAVAYS